MRDVSLWNAVLGVENKTVLESVEFDQGEDLVVARVRPTSRNRGRCGICGRPCPRYDSGEGRRRWRAPDLGTVKVVLEADAPRVSCRHHGVVVAAVPWARHGAGHTYAFDDTVAWLTVHCSKSAVRELMRVAWRTVSSIVTRVSADAMAGTDRFANLRRIGIDEISYKKGHRYITVVVNHDTRRLIWAAPGRDKATLSEFFDLLGPERCAAITHVSADAADWIADVVAERCPDAVQCADPFHIVKWATEALDEVRRDVWNTARAGGPHRARTRTRAGRQLAPRPARAPSWPNG